MAICWEVRKDNQQGRFVGFIEEKESKMKQYMMMCQTLKVKIKGCIWHEPKFTYWFFEAKDDRAARKETKKRFNRVKREGLEPSSSPELHQIREVSLE